MLMITQHQIHMQQTNLKGDGQTSLKGDGIKKQEVLVGKSY